HEAAHPVRTYHRPRRQTFAVRRSLAQFGKRSVITTRAPTSCGGTGDRAQLRAPGAGGGTMETPSSIAQFLARSSCRVRGDSLPAIHRRGGLAPARSGRFAKFAARSVQEM